MECLQGLVGLRSADSDDFGSFPDAYKVSSLNLWAWNLVGPEVLANARMDAADSGVNVVNELVDAYESAMDQLPAELTGFLGFRLQPVFNTFDGRFGEVATTGIVAVTGGKAGFALPTRRLDGASMTIRRLGLMLNASVLGLLITVTRCDGPLLVNPIGNLTSYLTSQYLASQTGEVIKVWDIDVTANDSKMYPVSPLNLPLDGSIYVISYQVTSAFFPYNNQLSCQCGGKDVTFNKMLTVPLATLNGNQAHGLLLDIVASCDFSGVVCDLLNNNQYTAAIGRMLYYKTGLNVLEKVLGGSLSPATQLSKEDLVAKRAEWDTELGKYLTWMTANWNPQFLPAERCYMCDSTGQLYRGNIQL